LYPLASAPGEARILLANWIGGRDVLVRSSGGSQVERVSH
jgi:hypothetical protein